MIVRRDRRRRIEFPDAGLNLVAVLGATQTGKCGAEMLGAALRSDDPQPVLPRWIVTNMLGVAALEVGHPVLFFVLMISDDRALRTLVDWNHVPGIQAQPAF
jgi:hypothetical protein